jgi:hypothetical protein
MSVALVIQPAKRTRHITCLDLQYFSTLSHKRYDIEGGGSLESIAIKMCVLIFSTNFSKIYFIPARINRDVIINAHRSVGKVPVIHVKL